MTKSEIQDGIKTFIVNELLDGNNAGLDVQAPLLEWGVIDSMSVVRLVTYIQDAFAISVPDSEINTSSFANVEALSSMVVRLQGAAGGAR